MNVIYVGLGGALGAVLRYGISLLPYKGTFPVLTLFTNILGALFIGFLAGMGAKKQLAPEWMLFLKTGVCGGFTTFSTFSLEAYQLAQRGDTALAGVYVVCSVGCSLAGIAAGMWLAK